MKKTLAILFVILLVLGVLAAGCKIVYNLTFARSQPASNTIVKPADLKYNPNCSEAVVVDGSTNGGRVEKNLDNGDSHSWSVTVINPDQPQGENTLVVITEPMWSFDVVYDVMYFTSERFDGTQAEVLCSAAKMADGTGELFVYAGETAPKGYYSADQAVGPWWTEMKVWEYQAEAIDAGVALTHFLGAQDESRLIDATGVVLAHGQLWRPGYPGKVVHPQIASGYTLAAPKGWEGTYWTYANPNEDIQARIIEATEKEVLPRDEIGTVVLLFCGPADAVPTTSFEFNGQTVTWVTNLDGWICTAP